jgi:hypothetical protein
MVRFYYALPASPVEADYIVSSAELPAGNIGKGKPARGKVP